MGKKKVNKIPLRRHFIERMPDEVTGIYAIWYKVNGTCLYVGQAQDQPLKVRLKQEWRDSHNSQLKKWISVFGDDIEFCYNIAAAGKIDKFETRLINKLAPETNIRKQRK